MKRVAYMKSFGSACKACKVRESYRMCSLLLVQSVQSLKHQCLGIPTKERYGARFVTLIECVLSSSVSWYNY